MSRKRHLCNCDYCVSGRLSKKLLGGGGLDTETDEEQLLPYRKGRSRKQNICSKSKTKEPHLFDEEIDLKIGNRVAYSYKICSRCGKHGEYTF